MLASGSRTLTVVAVRDMMNSERSSFYPMTEQAVRDYKIGGIVVDEQLSFFPLPFTDMSS